MKDSPKQVSTAINDPRIVSLIAYITPLGWFIAFILNHPRKTQTSFHIRQALGLHLIFIVGSMLFILPFLGWIVGMALYIASFIFLFYGFSLAWNGGQVGVPILGKYFQRWFKEL